MILLRSKDIMKKTLPILIAIIIALSACSPASVSPKEIVYSLCSAEIGLPAGRIYSTDAMENSPDFLSPELLAVTYGIPLDFGGIESAAIRLPGARHPIEFAVFLCKDASAAEDISLFCHRRIRDLLKNASSSAPLCNMSVEDYNRYLSGAFVTVSGRYVALIISSDPRSAKKALLKAL